MKRELLIISVLLLCSFYSKLIAQDIPLVYNVENTGDTFPAPVLPTLEELPVVEQLPDPFTWSDNTGQSLDFADWSHRRSEIKAEIEHYEIGTKPVVENTQVTASFSDNTLNIEITANGESMTMSCAVILPEGEGPFPAVIGMNSGSGSMSSAIFSDRDIAQVTYSHDQVTTYNGASNSDPFFLLYPEQNITNTGQYAAWSWGVSRIIDALERTQETLPIDLSHLAVSGCSYAGKMALFSGAFDERIALTIAQESGGGGGAAWRVSKTLGEVETLCATNNQWFANSMWDFCGEEEKLPHDHHELMAMCAPRALIFLGNPDYEWLADVSGYVSCRATNDVYTKFGIEDRFGFVIEGGHSHCAASANQDNAVAAFVDKFLLDSTEVNTDIEIHTFPDVEYLDWYDSWGGIPGVPRAKAGPNQNVVDENSNGYETVTLDASESFDKDGLIVSYVWTAADTLLATGVNPSVDLAIGTHIITLEVTDDSANVATDEVRIKVNPNQGPYEGTLHEMPGRIEAEFFDVGGNGYAYMDESAGNQTGIDFRTDEDVDIEECTDTDGGYNIGWWTKGEWLEYTVNVAVADTFDIELRVANGGDAKTIDIEIDDELVADNVKVNGTGGWQAWETVKAYKIILDEGEHVLRFTMGNTDYVNFNYFDFTYYVYDPLSINEAGNNEITLFPSLVKKQFTILLSETVNNAEASIFRVNGVFVKSISLNQPKNIIDASKLPSGMYIVKTNFNGQQIIHKFLKE